MTSPRLYSEPTPDPRDGFQRNYDRALYEIFREFALEDQRLYYNVRTRDNRQAARGVNMWRAVFSLAAGLSSAALTLLISTNQVDCTANPHSLCGPLALLAIVSVVAPAIAAAFGTLADLYQWDRASSIYEAAVENLVVADAESPDEQMDNDKYHQALRAYSSGTLQVMRDETAQWGSLIRTPSQIEEFIASARIQAELTEQRRVDAEE
ncbi:MAG: hypothetical protein NZM00_13860, partial [Anaerolinea sp.]|nr:hypothetical protein [Anaerolinea sp.]